MPFNKVILHGNLTRDIETRFTTTEKSVSNFGLAVNERWTTESGEKRERVTFVDCTAWGKIGEVLGDHLGKGDPILIEGRLQGEEWTDKETGEARRKLGVVVESFSFCGSSRKGEGGTPPAARSEPSSKTSPSPTGGSKTTSRR